MRPPSPFLPPRTPLTLPRSVRQNESLNQMSSSNLAIVFGPNLLGPKGGAEVEGNGLKDMGWQCKCVETILVHYSEIFVDLEG